VPTKPIVVEKKAENYKIFCVGTDFLKYISFETTETNLTLIRPINQFEGEKISVFGQGLGCLELAVYTLKKLDLETGIILNGEKNHAIIELKNGDKYSTEEIAKLTRSEKYLKANGVDPQKLMVNNSEGREMILKECRDIYQLSHYNQLLNMLSENPIGRVPVKRENSLEDLKKLIEGSENDPKQTENLSKIELKRKGIQY
jgi:hypothetical protein